jgi:hypothetical protein
MKLTTINFFALISAVLLTSMLVSTIESPKTAYSTDQKYNGTRTYITIWFDHVFASQKTAMNNMTAFGMKGGMLIVVDKANTTGYLTWVQIHKYIYLGWDPVSHSMDHAHISNFTSSSTLFNEIIVSKASLQYGQKIFSMGYASPYDEITPASGKMVNQTYKWTVIPGEARCSQNNVKTIVDNGKKYGFTIPVLYHCGIGFSGSPLNSVSQAKAEIDYAVAHKTWLVLNFHQIDNQNVAYHTPPSWFWQVLQYIKQQREAGNVTVATPCQGLGLC